MTLTAIILAFNEELHIARCLQNVATVVDEIIVVDSFSTDRTVHIAKSFGARVLQHEWINHSVQFNWALSQLNSDPKWILRIDADEYLTDELKEELRTNLFNLPEEVNGVYLNRRMKFQGRLIQYGGVFPVRVLRLFRFGHGRCEHRWMDEHIRVQGATALFKGELIDDSLITLTAWINKHNTYANREVIDLLNRQYRFAPYDEVAAYPFSGSSGKRWIKEVIYARLPAGVRAFGYYLYRYLLRAGFLDGREGAVFHFLHGLWYRYLVDAKLAEVSRYMRTTGQGPVQATREVLGLQVIAGPKPDAGSSVS